MVAGLHGERPIHVGEGAARVLEQPLDNRAATQRAGIGRVQFDGLVGIFERASQIVEVAAGIGAEAVGLGVARRLGDETIDRVESRAIIAAVDQRLDLFDCGLGSLRQGGEAKENGEGAKEDEPSSKHGCRKYTPLQRRPE
ncbi:MAG: hypothetical protein NTY38_25175 [Acidobacteria bacterium]|nr:hypothetical protein [Acidobacteriota bacterium]